MRRRTHFLLLGAVAVCAALAALLYLRHYRLPPPTGPYAVGTTLLHLTDRSRPAPYSAEPSARRELVVQLWYPAERSNAAEAPYMRWKEATLPLLYAPLLRTHSRTDAPILETGGKLPVLLFSPRWSGRRTQNTALIEDLASHGYVIAAVDYPGNGARVQLADGSVVSNSTAVNGLKGDAATAKERIDFWNKELTRAVSDQGFVLDQLAAMTDDAHNRFFGRLDTARVGAFGHSFGGAAALALCGADSRVIAALNMDGWTFAGLQKRSEKQQILILGEGYTRQREQQLKTLAAPESVEDQIDRADFASTESSLRAFGGSRIFLQGTQHMDFTDEPLLPPLRRPGFTGPLPAEQANRLLRTIVLGFFDEAFGRRSGSSFPMSLGNEQDVIVQRWSPTGRSAQESNMSPKDK